MASRRIVKYRHQEATRGEGKGRNTAAGTGTAKRHTESTKLRHLSPSLQQPPHEGSRKVEDA